MSRKYCAVAAPVEAVELGCNFVAVVVLVHIVVIGYCSRTAANSHGCSHCSPDFAGIPDSDTLDLAVAPGLRNRMLLAVVAAGILGLEKGFDCSCLEVLEVDSAGLDPLAVVAWACWYCSFLHLNCYVAVVEVAQYFQVCSDSASALLVLARRVYYENNVALVV